LSVYAKLKGAHPQIDIGGEVKNDADSELEFVDLQA
jgi:hypothetical protein